MKGSDCEICRYWVASQSNDFPCDECDGTSTSNVQNKLRNNKRISPHPHHLLG